MKNDGKIYIIVTDKAPAERVASAKTTTTKSETTADSDSLLGHWAKNHIISSTKSLINTATMYSLNNIGNFTGD